jgi:hypothetical protein
MTNYTCINCNKEFNKKSAYDSHLLRKKPCINEDNKNNECSFCNKLYSTKYNLKIHMNNCKKNNLNNKNEIEELKQLLLHQQKIQEEQQKMIEQLTELTETNKNITINDNSTNTINIQIIGLGNENMSDLTPQERGKVCTSGPNYQLEYIKTVHCNNKLPQYRNIKYTNLRANTGSILTNNGWSTLQFDDFINTITSTIRKKMLEMYKLDDFPETLKKHSLEGTKDYVLGNDSHGDKTQKIKLTLYNNSKNKP